MKSDRVRKNKKRTTGIAVLSVVLVAVVIAAVSIPFFKGKEREKRVITPSDNSPVVSSTDKTPSDAASVEPMRETDKELSKALDRIASDHRASAVQVAVIKNGKVVETYNYGSKDKSKQEPVTTDTVFRAASLSKLVDAMAVMKLSEEGKMDIDADVGKYLGYKVRSKKYPDTRITPRMLMSHTSGIVDSESFLKSRNSHSSVPLKKLLSQSSSFTSKQPGKSHKYSNFGIAVLAAAAEKKAGQPFYEYTENELFRPLGIKGSFLASRIEDSKSIACLYNTRGNPSYTVKRQLSEKCAKELGQTHHIYQGNITISAADYARLLCVLMNGGKGEDGQQILSPESADEILKIQFQSGSTNCGLCNYLSKTIVKGRTMHYHTGSNFGMYSSFAFDAEDQTGVVVFTSGADAKKESSGVYNVCGEIIRAVYKGSIIQD